MHLPNFDPKLDPSIYPAIQNVCKILRSLIMEGVLGGQKTEAVKLPTIFFLRIVVITNISNDQSMFSSDILIWI